MARDAVLFSASLQYCAVSLLLLRLLLIRLLWSVVCGRGEGRSFMVSSSRTGTEYCCCFTVHRIFNQEYRYDIQRMESPSSEHRVPFGWQICNMQQYNVKPITLDTIYRVPSTLLSHRSSPSLIVHSFTSLSKVRKTRYLPIP